MTDSQKLDIILSKIEKIDNIENEMKEVKRTLGDEIKEVKRTLGPYTEDRGRNAPNRREYGKIPKTVPKI